MDIMEKLSRLIDEKRGYKTAPAQEIDFTKIKSIKKAPQQRKSADEALGIILGEVEKKNPRQWTDVRRIIDVPISYPITEAELEDVQRRWVLAGAQMGGKPFLLKEQQAAAVLAFEKWRGAFAKIGVGKGKTFTTLMIAQAGYDSGIKKIMLNVPAHVYAQLTLKDIPMARKLLRFTLPVHRMGDSTPARRKKIAKSGKVGLYVYPYSLMSGREAHEEMEAINAGLVISDECQHVANTRSARGKRYRRYCVEKQPRVVVLSGTITRKSIREYQHLATLSLRENSFLPHSPQIASEWGRVLDSAGSVDGKAATGPLRPLIDWAENNFPSQAFTFDLGGFRKAYKLRMEHTPGVVSSGDEELGTSLAICNQPVPDHEHAEGWDDLESLMHKVENEWLTPSGDEIEHAIHTFKWMFELSAGFYNNLVWPEPEDLAERRGISVLEASALLARAGELHAAKQAHARELRDWLRDHHFPGLDTPFLVASDMARHGAANVGPDLYHTWSVVQDLKDDTLPERDSFPVRVCSYKIDHAIRWAMRYWDEGGILWYHHQEVGRWLYEALTEAGLDPLYCPAGNLHNRTILDSQGRMVIASMSAHGVGKNLQFHGNQHFVQWQRSAANAEQTLGRTHRLGQLRDGLEVHTNHTIEWDVMNFAACLNDSLYIHQSMQEQKLIVASYDPVPKIMPWEVLKERGFQPHEMPVEMQQMLSEKFDL